MTTNEKKMRLFERVRRCEWEIGTLNQILTNGQTIINGIVFTADELRPTFADKIAVISAEINRLNAEIAALPANDCNGVAT